MQSGDDEHLEDRGLPPLAWLRTFVAAASAGGIRSAGRNLGLHHSVISRQITQLEASLGVALRNPRARQFSLTVEGSKYYERIASPLAEIAGATREIREKADDSTLQVWCSPSFSVQWLASEVSRFRQLYPNYEIELRPSDEPANLRAYQADVNLYLHLDHDGPPPAEPNVRTFELGRPTSIIAASPGLCSQLPPLLSAEDILTCPLLHSGHRSEWELWLKMNGVDIGGEVPGELCWNPLMALEAARLGRGLLWGNRLFFERSFARGELVEVSVAGLAPVPVGTYIFSGREDRWGRSAMKALRHFLRDRMMASE